MANFIKIGMVLILLAGWCATAAASQEVTKAQIKGLDEQVQEVKSDVLAIAAELNLLEEKLLYPSQTQISLFVALDADDKLRLDAVDISLNGKLVAQYLYSYKELEALQMGGVQRIYTGNMKIGEHPLQVTFLGKTASGKDFRISDDFTVQKSVGPAMVELTLTRHGVTFKNR